MSRLCLLAVVRADHPAVPVEQRSGGPSDRFVVVGRVAAALHVLEDGPAVRLRDMRAYLAGVAQLFALGPVLPFRFPTVVDTTDSVTSVLEAAEEAYAMELDRLEGLCELSITVREDEHEALRDLLDADRGVRGLSATTRRGGTLDGMIRLGELVHERLQRRHAETTEQLRRRIGSHAVDVVERPAGSATVVRMSVLVPAAARASVTDAVAKLSRDTAGRLDTVVSEPLAPFSFVRLPSAQREAGVGGGRRWAS